MRKTQTQRNKEHIARLRRKAQAYDRLVNGLRSVLPTFDILSGEVAAYIVQVNVDEAEKAVQE